jgi:hypothetical protein
MASPQTGIFALGTAAHAYLEFDVLASANGPAAVANVARLREPRTMIGGVNLGRVSGPSCGRSSRPTRPRPASLVVCASQDPLRLMLESMVGRGSEPPDGLTSVARAVTGAYYVIPSAHRLAAFGAEDRA